MYSYIARLLPNANNITKKIYSIIYYNNTQLDGDFGVRVALPDTALPDGEN